MRRKRTERRCQWCGCRLWGPCRRRRRSRLCCSLFTLERLQSPPWMEDREKQEQRHFRARRATAAAAAAAT